MGQAEWQATRYWQRRARRECVRCGAKTGHGGAHCVTCEAWKRAYVRARRRQESPEEKREHCRRAAQARWRKHMPKLTQIRMAKAAEPAPAEVQREVQEPVTLPMSRYRGRPVLTIHQACARASVSRRTIYNWIAAGKIAVVHTAGGAIRIIEDSLWRESA